MCKLRRDKPSCTPQNSKKIVFLFFNVNNITFSYYLHYFDTTIHITPLKKQNIIIHPPNFSTFNPQLLTLDL